MSVFIISLKLLKTDSTLTWARHVHYRRALSVSGRCLARRFYSDDVKRVVRLNDLSASNRGNKQGQKTPHKLKSARGDNSLPDRSKRDIQRANLTYQKEPDFQFRDESLSWRHRDKKRPSYYRQPDWGNNSANTDNTELWRTDHESEPDWGIKPLSRGDNRVKKKKDHEREPFVSLAEKVRTRAALKVRRPREFTAKELEEEEKFTKFLSERFNSEENQFGKIGTERAVMDKFVEPVRRGNMEVDLEERHANITELFSKEPEKTPNKVIKSKTDLPKTWSQEFGTLASNENIDPVESRLDPSIKYRKEIEEEEALSNIHNHIPLGTRNRRHEPDWYSRRIRKLGRQGHVAEAIEVFEEWMLKQDRVKPTDFEYSSLISVLGKAGYTEKAFRLYSDMTKRGLKIHPSVFTSLFNACSNSPWPEDGLDRARRLQRKMLVKNVRPAYITYQAMIKAFGLCGDIRTAFECADEALHFYKPTENLLDSLLCACLSDKTAGFRHAVMVWRKFHVLKVKPSIISYKLILRIANSCCIGEQKLLMQLLVGDIGSMKVEKNLSGISGETLNKDYIKIPHEFQGDTKPIIEDDSIMNRELASNTSDRENSTGVYDGVHAVLDNTKIVDLEITDSGDSLESEDINAVAITPNILGDRTQFSHSYIKLPIDFYVGLPSRIDACVVTDKNNDSVGATSVKVKSLENSKYTSDKHQNVLISEDTNNAFEISQKPEETNDLTYPRHVEYGNEKVIERSKPTDSEENGYRNTSSLLPSILNPKADFQRVLKLNKVKHHKDRFALLGGVKGVLKIMKEDGVKPDSRIFGYFIQLAQADELKEVLDEMVIANVVPDREFFNLYIRRLICEKQSFEEVAEVMKRLNIEPNIQTYYFMALGCTTHKAAVVFLKEMENANIMPTIEIFHSLISTSKLRLDFKMNLLKEMQRLEIKPNLELLKLIENQIADARNLALKMDKSTSSRAQKFKKSFDRFLTYYEKWTKAVEMEPVDHPWKGFQLRKD